MMNVLATAPLDFGAVSAARAYLAGRVLARFVVPARDLRVGPDATIEHAGALAMAPLRAVPLTDRALRNLERIVGLPSAYGRRIPTELHVQSLNELLARHPALVTVIVEHEHGHEEERRVAAIVAGAATSAMSEPILRRVEDLGIDGAVRIDGGVVELRWGIRDVEVLASDVISSSGALSVDDWRSRSTRGRDVAEVSVHLLRLICSNGAYAQRRLGGAKLQPWASAKQLNDFVAREIERVHTFPSSALELAAMRMCRSMPTDIEHHRIASIITRSAGRAHAEEALRTAVSWYDHWNAVTGAAHQLPDDARERRRTLEVQGGAIIDRFIAAPGPIA
jgi:hypothetical protein